MKTSPRTITRQQPDPLRLAFQTAQRVAATSVIATLEAGALELGDRDVTVGIDAAAEVLRRVYKANGTQVGAGGEYDAELVIREEAGYLYGLAIGLAIGRGRTR